jgi:hypothetical protein
VTASVALFAPRDRSSHPNSHPSAGRHSENELIMAAGLVTTDVRRACSAASPVSDRTRRAGNARACAARRSKLVSQIRSAGSALYEMEPRTAARLLQDVAAHDRAEGAGHRGSSCGAVEGRRRIDIPVRARTRAFTSPGVEPPRPVPRPARGADHQPATSIQLHLTATPGKHGARYRMRPRRLALA